MPILEVAYIQPDDYKFLAFALENKADRKGSLLNLDLLTREQLAVALKYIKEDDLYRLRQPVQGHGEAGQWLSYWREMLRYADLDGLAQQPRIRAEWYARADVSWEEIRAGKVAFNEKRAQSKDWQDLVAAATDAANRPDGPPPNCCHVLITFGYEWQDRNGKYVQLVAGAIPATINLLTGALAPISTDVFVNQRHLGSPDRDARKPRIGPLRETGPQASTVPSVPDRDAQQNSQEQQDAPQEQAWQVFWERQNEVFCSYQDTAPRAIDAFSWRQGSGVERRFTFLGMAGYTAIPPANRRLLDLIDDIQRQEKPAPLLARLLAGDRNPEDAAAFHWGSPQAPSVRLHHGGHAGGDFGLDATQRLALWQTTDSGEGRVFAVAGPPGTGKTSMLQGVIATIMVKATLDNKAPIVLAASQTNQATTNMIKAFAEIAQPRNDGDAIRVEHRWIEGFPSYGWYFPSATKRKTGGPGKFQILYRDPFIAPELFASGTATNADGSARSVSHINEDVQKTYQAQFNRCFREYLAVQGLKEQADPLVWLRNEVTQLAGANANSRLGRSLRTCDQLHDILQSCSVDGLRAAQRRERHLSRPLPADRQARIAQAQARRAAFESQSDKLIKASASTHRLAPSGFWQHVRAWMEEFVPSRRRARDARLQQDVNHLVRTYLEADPAFVAPMQLEALQAALPAMVERLKHAVAQQHLHEERWQRWQARRACVEQQRAAQLSALGSQLKMSDRLAKSVRELHELFLTYRGEQAHKRFSAGFKDGLALDNQDHPHYQLGRTLHRQLLAAGPGSPDALALRQVLESIVDVTIRYRAFHLSMRYWEGTWIKECATPLPLDSRAEVLESIRRAAMLAPVIVATAQTMPALALYLNAERVPTHAIGGADWLIIDEAGQVPPQLAVPLTALARQALVVGDVHQLAPVVNIDRRANRDLRRRFGLGDMRDQHSLFNLDALAGNMMACAQFSAARHENIAAGRRGTMLKYHYRCRETIIEFCNRLVYDAIDPLIPMIPDAARFARTPAQASATESLLPPMGFVAVDGKQVASGESQTNPDEVNEIANWLRENRNAITARYGNVEDSVAIISPYGAQVKALSARMSALGFKVKDDKQGQADPENIADKGAGMVVGTVHSLQGAETRIVLFSAVNDGTAKVFLDSSPSMLNVAVSRAQHAFVVFGHPKVVLQPGSTPSGVLGKYLRLHGYRLYPRELVILESSAKVDLVEQAFGKLAEGVATGGHFRELQLDESGAPAWRLTDKGSALNNALRQFASLGEKHVDAVYLATDDDREGEAIAWHVMDMVRQQGIRLPAVCFKRLRFYAMSPQALLEGRQLATTGVDPQRVKAALTRSLADRLIATHIKKVSGVSVGRVSAALLDEITRLDQARAPRLVEKVEASLDGRLISFSRLAEDDPLGRAATVEYSASENSLTLVGARALVERIGPVILQEAAAPPSSTAQVVAAAVDRLGLSPAQAMAALQEIYEGVAPSLSATQNGELDD